MRNRAELKEAMQQEPLSNTPTNLVRGGYCQHRCWTLSTVAWLTQHTEGFWTALKTPTATAVRDFSTVSIPVPYSTRFSVWDGYLWLAKLRCRHLCSRCKRGWETTHLPFLVSMEGSSLWLSWFWTHFQQVGVGRGTEELPHTPKQFFRPAGCLLHSDTIYPKASDSTG